MQHLQIEQAKQEVKQHERSVVRWVKKMQRETSVHQRRHHVKCRHDLKECEDTYNPYAWTIAKEHTLFGPKLEFATIVRAKMRPACTPKHFEE
jgi:hypothetical protein